MQILKTCLLDVNIWLALAAEGHVHHQRTREWFLARDQKQAQFCRISQMGFLRLLTHPSAMGSGVMTPRSAWKIYEQFRTDPRVSFMDEPSGMEATWMRLMGGSSGHRTWTDA